MTKQSVSYDAGLHEDLCDPAEAAAYLLEHVKSIHQNCHAAMRPVAQRIDIFCRSGIICRHD